MSDPYDPRSGYTQPGGVPQYPYQQPVYPQPMYGPMPVQPVMIVEPVTSGWATASMLLGIAGIFLGGCTLGLPCVAAVVCGHVAMREIKRTGVYGRPQAIGGMIFGYVMFAVTWGLMIALMSPHG